MTLLNWRLILPFGASLLLIGCDRPGEDAETIPDHGATESQVAFFDNLSTFCGEAFAGRADYSSNPEAHAELVEGPLYMEVASCTEQELRIPFIVGENRSRTWVLTLAPEGLLLKHDHRHADGTPEELTMYGGYASETGDESEQFFPADEYTAEMLPEAATNVWSLHFDHDQQTFTYYLERHGEPRYRAIFDLGQPAVPDGE